jgi:hypothetical protein
VHRCVGKTCREYCGQTICESDEGCNGRECRGFRDTFACADDVICTTNSTNYLRQTGLTPRCDLKAKQCVDMGWSCMSRLVRGVLTAMRVADVSPAQLILNASVRVREEFNCLEVARAVDSCGLRVGVDFVLPAASSCIAPYAAGAIEFPIVAAGRWRVEVALTCEQGPGGFQCLVDGIAENRRFATAAA